MDIDSIVINRVTPANGCPEVGLAAFIVGSLCHEGYVPLDLGNSESRQDYVNSIQLVASILTETKAPEGECTQLPFPW